MFDDCQFVAFLVSSSRCIFRASESGYEWPANGCQSVYCVRVYFSSF